MKLYDRIVTTEPTMTRAATDIAEHSLPAWLYRDAGFFEL